MRSSTSNQDSGQNRTSAPKILQVVGEGRSCRWTARDLGTRKNTVLDVVRRHRQAELMCVLAALSIKCAEIAHECDEKRRRNVQSVISPSTGIDRELSDIAIDGHGATTPIPDRRRRCRRPPPDQPRRSPSCSPLGPRLARSGNPPAGCRSRRSRSSGRRRLPTMPFPRLMP